MVSYYRKCLQDCASLFKLCVYFQMLILTIMIVYSHFPVGNKNDCPERKVVQTEDATKFSEQIGIQLFETSAKENLNVEEVSTRK